MQVRRQDGRRPSLKLNKIMYCTADCVRLQYKPLEIYGPKWTFDDLACLKMNLHVVALLPRHARGRDSFIFVRGALCPTNLND